MVGVATFAEPSEPPCELAVEDGRSSFLTFHWTGGRGADLRLGQGLDRRVEGGAEHGDVQLERVVEQRRRTARLDLDLPDARLSARRTSAGPGGRCSPGCRSSGSSRSSSCPRRATPYGWMRDEAGLAARGQTAEGDLEGLGALGHGDEVRLVAVALHRAGCPRSVYAGFASGVGDDHGGQDLLVDALGASRRPAAGCRCGRRPTWRWPRP